MREPYPRARLGALAVLAILVLALAGPPDCGGGAEADRATLCRRAVPALAQLGAEVEILHAGRGAAPGSARVDYRLAGQREAKARWIVCTFGQGTDLNTISTESGPMSGASVYLLKHYFLDTPDAAAADPGAR